MATPPRSMPPTRTFRLQVGCCVLAALGAACASTGGGPDPVAACEDYVAAFCEPQVRCGLVALDACTAAEEASFPTPGCDSADAIRDTVALGQCEGELRSMDCYAAQALFDTHELPESCQGQLLFITLDAADAASADTQTKAPAADVE